MAVVDEYEEAARTAAALICCVIDKDARAAEALLGDTSHQVIAQACTDLARWIVESCVTDLGEFRAGIAAQLLNQAARDCG